VIDLRLGDSRAVLRTLPDASVDAVITNPPYPEISREYGRWTEAEWHDLMRAVVAECRRILKPTGSAVFILQPNSERVGKMRPWLWEFMAWACREWNMVQDAWWWNINAFTVAGSTDKGLLRPSLKACVWLGNPNCYRDQDSVLWEESDGAKSARLAGRFDRINHPSGWRSNSKPRETNGLSIRMAAERRGGVTPFNVIPVGKSNWADGHPAAIPPSLLDFWIRYISPPDGVVCDPFMGSGTCGLAALKRGRSFVGIESFPKYFTIAERRVTEARAEQPLFAS
jgi:DNA modification methylase